MGDRWGDVSSALLNVSGFPRVCVWFPDEGTQGGLRAGLSGVTAARGGLCPMTGVGDPADQLCGAWPSA